MNEPMTSETARRPSVAPSPLQAELDAILGSLAHNRPAASPSEDRELLVEVRKGFDGIYGID